METDTDVNCYTNSQESETMEMNKAEINHEVVIVGAGIAGLATALALHRKGITSVVFERSETLRETGAALGIQANGWRALDQLGVGDTLRKTAVRLQSVQAIGPGMNKNQRTSFNGEARCLKRIVLVKTLFDALPPGTVHFGCHIVSVALDPQTTYPVLQLADGSSAMTKILIACDGGHSVIGEFLGAKPTKALSTWSIRGLTIYPDGHSFGNEAVRMWVDEVMLGRVPMDDKSVYWFVAMRRIPEEAKIWGDPQLIKQTVMESLNGAPQEFVDMIKSSEPDSVSLTHIRYRSPWDLLMGNFRKGTVTVAGDAMHVMGPFLGQGGAAALEDSIVLARRLGQKLSYLNAAECGRKVMVQEIGEALDEYLKERRMRLVRLSVQTYLTGSLFLSRSKLMQLIYILLLAILFRNRNGHTNFDCGHL